MSGAEIECRAHPGRRAPAPRSSISFLHTIRHCAISPRSPDSRWLVATRSGGHFATLYTHIDDLTESLRDCHPGGDQRVPASGSGAGPSPGLVVPRVRGTLGHHHRERGNKCPRWQVTASVLGRLPPRRDRLICLWAAVPGQLPALDPPSKARECRHVRWWRAVGAGVPGLADHPIDPRCTGRCDHRRAAR